MTPEQLKQLQEVLKDIVVALYTQMGQKWCEDMMININKIKPS